jgi:hypothetical protein
MLLVMLLSVAALAVAREQASIEIADDVDASLREALLAQVRDLECVGTVRVSAPNHNTLRIEQRRAGQPVVARAVRLGRDAQENAKLATHLLFNMCANEADAFLRRSRDDAGGADGQAVDAGGDGSVAAEAARDAEADATWVVPDASPDVSPDASPNASPDVSPQASVSVGTPAPPLCKPAPQAPAVFALAGPLALPAGRRDTNLLVSIIHGRAETLRGVGIGGIVQACAFRGLGVGLQAVLTEREATGAFFSNGLNLHGGRLDGVSAALLVVSKDTSGAVVAPIHVNSGAFTGLELGVVNVVTGNVLGAQIGIVNIAASGFRGAQIGILNIGGDIRGTQIGVVNVAKDSDASVGAQSFAWAQPIRPYAWTTTVVPLQVGIMWDGRRVFSGVSFGRLVSVVLQGKSFGLGFDLGVHLIKSEPRGLVLDALLSADAAAPASGDGFTSVLHLGSRLGYRFLPRFLPFLYGGVAFSEDSDSIADPNAETKVAPEFGAGVVF